MRKICGPEEDIRSVLVDVLPNTKYGIMLSGGLDSACLMYLIIEECLTKNIDVNLSVFNIPKTDGSSLYVNNIITYFNKKYDLKIPAAIKVGNPKAHHTEQSKTAITDIFTNYNIDKLFVGTNQNPPPPFDLKKFGEGKYPDRVTSSPDPSKIIMPFINLHKSHVVDILFQTKQQELIEITHTCTERQVGRCGECFQCQERKWAFDQLQEEDYGIR